MDRSTYTAILEKEGDLFVALCPELDIASQGSTVEEATANLKEAVELFLECADPEEIRQRLHMQRQIQGSTVTVPVPDHPEIKIGTLLSIIRQSGIPRTEFEQ
jgi:predicted RNase H-like HicB family nuclease